MTKFPERINNYCEVNGLSSAHFFGKGSSINGKIEEYGLFVLNNSMNFKSDVELLEILQVTIPITNDLFFPNFIFYSGFVVHLHILLDNRQFWVFANPQNQIDKINSISCIPDCEHVKLTQQQLQDLLKQQDQFVNLISHDFRSPLSTLIEGVDIVHANLKSKFELNEFDEVIMEQLKEELVQLLLYTNKLHDWAKLDTKADPSQFEEFTFSQVIASIENLFLGALMEKKIDLIKDFNPDLKYYTDRRLFSLVIHHLFDNSIKFSANGGTIKISANQEYVQIADNGEGIILEKLEQIKKGYLTKNRKLFGKGIGPGLGLNIVLRILRSLHYTCEIQSEVGIGTSFTIKMR